MQKKTSEGTNGHEKPWGQKMQGRRDNRQCQRVCIELCIVLIICQEPWSWVVNSQDKSDILQECLSHLLKMQWKAATGANRRIGIVSRRPSSCCNSVNRLWKDVINCLVLQSYPFQTQMHKSHYCICHLVIWPLNSIVEENVSELTDRVGREGEWCKMHSRVDLTAFAGNSFLVILPTGFGKS